jgi:hypothetical protein
MRRSFAPEGGAGGGSKEQGIEMSPFAIPPVGRIICKTKLKRSSESLHHRRDFDLH